MRVNCLKTKKWKTGNVLLPDVQKRLAPSSWARKERTKRQVFNNTAFWTAASTLATPRFLSWLMHLTCTFPVAVFTMGWTLIVFTLHIFVTSCFSWLYFWILVIYVSWMFLSRGMAMSMILTRWARLSYKTIVYDSVRRTWT